MPAGIPQTSAAKLYSAVKKEIPLTFAAVSARVLGKRLNFGIDLASGAWQILRLCSSEPDHRRVPNSAGRHQRCGGREWSLMGLMHCQGAAGSTGWSVRCKTNHPQGSIWTKVAWWDRGPTYSTSDPLPLCQPVPRFSIQRIFSALCLQHF
jgi:hypothetical protein